MEKNALEITIKPKPKLPFVSRARFEELQDYYNTLLDAHIELINRVSRKLDDLSAGEPNG